MANKRRKRKDQKNTLAGNIILILMMILAFWRFGDDGQLWEYTLNQVEEVALFSGVTEKVEEVVEASITYIDEWKVLLEDVVTTQTTTETIDIEDIPEYTGDTYIVINDNIPEFLESDLTTTSYETYSALDSLGRCGVAMANIGQDIMPTEDRGSISSVTPSGWENVTYDFIDGTYLYNRCHLIGFQLTGENANAENLITGTRSFNVDGMLPWENLVTDYIEETNYHVLYRVTPIYDGDDLVAQGVQMEAFSVEDDGDGISFNIFVYNVEDGVIIDYSTGLSETDTEWTEDAA